MLHSVILIVAEQIQWKSMSNEGIIILMNASGMNGSDSSWNFTRVNLTSGFPSPVCMHL